MSMAVRLLATWSIALVLGGGIPGATAGEAGPEARAARRRWAMARMDEMANERRRCQERFAKRHDVERCEADYTRRFREYNDAYLEASRD